MKNLTAQETKILKLLSAGKKTKDISSELFISPHTVKNHKSNICRKLSLGSTTALLLFAYKQIDNKL